MSYNAGENNPMWNGGVIIDMRGRSLLWQPEHPRANPNGYVFEHILNAEKVFGKFITANHPIHHVDGVLLNNANHNLVICEDTSYHALLHRRARALKACGHANWVMCRECKQYGPQETMTLHSTRKTQKIYIHKYCNAERMARWRKKNPDYWRKFYRRKKRGSSS